MDKRTRFSVPAIGGGALLTMFAVLCLVVFTLFTLTDALSTRRLSEGSAETAAAYYAADTEGEKIYALLRVGEMPEGVREENGIYYYSCPIGPGSALSIELRQTGGGWEVLRWQSVSTDEWSADDSIDVWKGDEK